MLIGAISDTHIPDLVQSLPPQIAKAFAHVDLILHAGDICAPSVLDELERLAPVLAARGDDDSFTTYDARVKEEHILTIEGYRLWLTHVMPGPSVVDSRYGLNPVDYFRGATDILVFGHLHRPRVDNSEGVLLVNPGSPTLPDYAPRLGTVALLTITPGKAEATIVQLG
ncbi:MAG: metallophosphoesterase family protein [Dehalococcoidia bacterium]